MRFCVLPSVALNDVTLRVPSAWQHRSRQAFCRSSHSAVMLADSGMCRSIMYKAGKSAQDVVSWEKNSEPAVEAGSAPGFPVHPLG